jgi:galactokinase
LHDIFEREFGRPAGVATSAPGRVNIIGEHTDYNGGFMLPIALPHRTDVLLAVRDDSLVRVRSLDLGDAAPLAEYRLDEERQHGNWLDYVQGVTRVARTVRSHVPGCDILISSTVPIGKGLSSSAALQVSLFRALNQAWQLDLDDLSIAKLAHRAETEFVGAPVGIMDQIAASLGSETAALLIDARSLAIESVPIPADVELAVLDSGIRHSHVSGDYKIRRRDCEDAAKRLGVEQLRDLDESDLPKLNQLPPPLGQRARHVITENARVLATVRAFREGDVARAGHLLSLSHQSLRDDFEVSTPDVDRLVQLADGEPDVFGARITGGGFGGAVVALCRRPHAASAAGRVIEHYRALTRCEGAVLLPVPAHASRI